MPLVGYFIDANLLVLLIVGSIGEELIARHRRLQNFTAEDYRSLRNLLDQVDQVFVTLRSERSRLEAQTCPAEW